MIFSVSVITLLIISAVVFFLSSLRRTEVSPQGSLNFHPSHWNKGRRGLLILQDTKYCQIITSIPLMMLQEWDGFMQHLLHILDAWENSLISLTSILYWTNEEKEKKWTWSRVYLIFSWRHVSLICFILSCQAYRQLNRKMRMWRKKVAKRRSREWM